MNGSIALPNPPAIAPARNGPTRNGSGRRWYVWPAVSLLTLAALAGVWGARRISGGSGGPVVAGKFFAVAPMDLDIKVRKDGELQAVNNVDVTCMVEGRSTIVYLVKEGENVKKATLPAKTAPSPLPRPPQPGRLEGKKAVSDCATRARC